MEVRAAGAADAEAVDRHAVTPFESGSEIVVPVHIVAGATRQQFDLVAVGQQRRVLPCQRLGTPNEALVATRHDDRDPFHVEALNGSSASRKRALNTSGANSEA